MMRVFSVAALLLLGLSVSGCASQSTCPNQAGRPLLQAPAGALRHVVVFKFKETASDAQIKEIIDAFAGLQDQVDGMIAFEYGTNISTEGLDQGFTHVFVATFKGQAALDAYLPHPAHKAFVEKLLPILEQPFVVDYVLP